jgi:hypothetical protein
VDVDAAAESPGSAVFTSGLCMSEYSPTAYHAACRDYRERLPITIGGMRPFESDAFYGPINIGGLK